MQVLIAVPDSLWALVTFTDHPCRKYIESNMVTVMQFPAELHLSDCIERNYFNPATFTQSDRFAIY